MKVKVTIKDLQDRINKLQGELDSLKPPPPTLEESLQEVLKGHKITQMHCTPKYDTFRYGKSLLVGVDILINAKKK